MTAEENISGVYGMFLVDCSHCSPWVSHNLQCFIFLLDGGSWLVAGIWSLISPDSCMRLTSPWNRGQTSPKWPKCPTQNEVHWNQIGNEPVVYLLYLWFSKFDSTPCMSCLTNCWYCWVRIDLLQGNFTKTQFFGVNYKQWLPPSHKNKSLYTYADI